MHLHELLKMSIQDYEVERQRIETLFEHTGFRFSPRSYPARSLKDFVAEQFRGSKIRGTATDITDFLNVCKRYWVKPSIEGLLFYCETIFNILEECKNRISDWNASCDLKKQIYSNIDIVLDKTGYELRKTDDNFWEIVKKDALSSIVIEDLSDADVASAILDYNHFGMKGDIAKKRELLVTIGRYVEPLTDDVEMKGAHSGLVDDVRFCLNNLHIRHNNEEGKFAKDWLEKMSGEELESWYDKAYRSMLLLIEEHKHLETHRQINALKKQGKI